MSLRRVKVKRRVAKVSVTVSEAGRLYLRVMRGKKTVSTRRVAIKAGASSASVRLPKRHAKYRLAIWAQDAGGLESKWRYRTVKL